jgi:hypothetical protein
VAKAGPGWEVVTVPLESLALRSAGPTHADAFDPSGGAVQEPAGEEVVQLSIKTDDYGYYDLERTVLRASLPQVTRILTAALVLEDVRTGWDTFYEPLPAPTINLHPGTWASADWAHSADLWAAYDGSVVGSCDTEPFYAAGSRRKRLAMELDPSWLRPGQALRLTMRDSQDHVDFRETYADNRTRWVVGLVGAHLRLTVE